MSIKLPCSCKGLWHPPSLDQSRAEEHEIVASLTQTARYVQSDRNNLACTGDCVCCDCSLHTHTYTLYGKVICI